MQGQLDQGIDQGQVPVLVESVVEGRQEGLTLGGQPGQQQRSRLPIRTRLQIFHRLGQPLPQHVGIPHRPQEATDPAELVQQRHQRLRIEHGPERPQIAPQAPGGHPSLVHALVAGVEPDDGIVQEQPAD